MLEGYSFCEILIIGEQEQDLYSPWRVRFRPLVNGYGHEVSWSIRCKWLDRSDVTGEKVRAITQHAPFLAESCSRHDGIVQWHLRSSGAKTDGSKASQNTGQCLSPTDDLDSATDRENASDHRPSI